MKIYLSKPRLIELVFALCVEATFVGFILYFWIDDRDIIIFVVLVLFIGLCIWITYKLRRILVNVRVDQSGFRSYLLGKHLCNVDNHDKVYYIVLKCGDITLSVKTFAVISNTPFDYDGNRGRGGKTKNHSQFLLDFYDLETQIALPCDERTIPFFDYDNWICVGNYTS